MTCDVQPGRIYKIPFPFTDLSEAKARPALALSSPDPFGDVPFGFITTTPPQAIEWHMELQESDYEGLPLPFKSFLRMDKVYLLHRSIAIKELAQLSQQTMAEILRKQILRRIPDFHSHAHGSQVFVPGKSPVPVSGKVYGSAEMENLVASALDFWLTSGRFIEDCCDALGSKYSIGSSPFTPHPSLFTLENHSNERDHDYSISRGTGLR